METVLHLSVLVDHAGDEDGVQVLRDACDEIRDVCEGAGLSPAARALLDALLDAVDDAEEA